jgi:hypothetical protein
MAIGTQNISVSSARIQDNAVTTSKINDTAVTLAKLNSDVTGTSANKLVKLDASAKLPAIDGSQLTNIGNQIVQIATDRETTATSTNSGSYVDSAFSITLTTTASNKLLCLFSSGAYLGGDGMFYRMLQGSTVLGEGKIRPAAGYPTASIIALGTAVGGSETVKIQFKSMDANIEYLNGSSTENFTASLNVIEIKP